MLSPSFWHERIPRSVAYYRSSETSGERGGRRKMGGVKNVAFVSE